MGETLRKIICMENKGEGRGTHFVSQKKREGLKGLDVNGGSLFC